MTLDVWKPSLFKSVNIYLCWESTPLTYDMSLNDYISFMWQLKTRAFITLWNVTINKMHILKIDTEISLARDVSNFINDQRKSSFDSGMTWEELYNQWCYWLSKRRDENREFTLMMK